MYKVFERELLGSSKYDESVEVRTDESYKHEAEAGRTCIDVRVNSCNEVVYASLTIEQAKQHIEHVRQAIEFLENP